MIKSATLRFGIGCSILVFSAILQLVFPGFLPFILITLAVGFCIRQWYRRTRESEKSNSARTNDTSGCRPIYKCKIQIAAYRKNKAAEISKAMSY